MKNLLLSLCALCLAACGGGGGGGNNAAPTPTPQPAPTPPTSSAPTPSGFFTDASATLPASRASGCFDARAVDIDTDGDLDLLIAGFAQSGSPNLLYINDGNGVFSDASATNLPANSQVSEHVATGDFDTDGDVDVVFANVNSGGSTHEFYLNTGVGGVLEAAPQGLPAGGLSAFVATRDFDNDNDLDLFFSNFGASTLLVNDGFATFADESAARLPGNDPEITEDSGIGDVNGDGFEDIVLAYRGSQFEGEGAQNRLWLNNGLGVFSDNTATGMPALSDSTFDIVLADVDGDFDLDAVVANATIGTTNAPLLDSLLINDGNGTFSDATATRWPQTSLSNTYGVTLVDIDRDGDLDILTAENLGGSGTGQTRAFGNDGSGNFSARTNQLLGTVRGNFAHIEAADFNGDGLVDLYFCANRNFGTADSARDFLFLGR